ncbi:hypothetical protein [Glycomyces arizonensis]|uniref:hypothetical protein n=1 Tax=Glycomyces arizonensis TaxID=256035 RepID=UPI0004185AFD|nr:hypothetical protein [Glycomyces arizonensis]
MLALTGCSALTGESSDGGGDAAEGSPVSAEIKSWDPCEVLDNLQPIVDFMHIAEINSSDGQLTSAMYGEGLDAQALTCFGMVIASKFETIYDETKFNEGEISVGIIPWDTVEDAELSYEERTGPDQERRAEGGAGFEFTGEEELTSSEWDEGKLFVAQDDQSHYYDAYIRDGEWLLWVSIDFNIDNAITYYEANENKLDGPLEDYLSYEFTPEELQQWLIDEYIPQTHESISSRIPQE